MYVSIFIRMYLLIDFMTMYFDDFSFRIFHYSEIVKYMAGTPLLIHPPHACTRHCFRHGDCHGE